MTASPISDDLELIREHNFKLVVRSVDYPGEIAEIQVDFRVIVTQPPCNCQEILW